ncbi:Endonuclease/exonuclease/phosphatase [Gymnopilus junonius]|uniref:Endonuclease/exonuclease/phosphatase n=1 Tax=Gymnopilus junonius TaxID=109634 RepID=A0A9P5NFF4_GYMJU|nr:Endonuclease/exonuclease/phosphatase [Gymnopilus junonius]
MRTRSFGNTLPSKWQCVPWLPWNKQKLATSEVVAQLNVPNQILFSNIVTWNINGFHSKYNYIAKMLYDQKIGIACLQEMLFNSARQPLVIKGYETYGIDREVGFRGQAILIDTLLPSYQIPHVEKHLLHVQVLCWSTPIGTIQLDIFLVYLPSGGNHRRDRKKILSTLCQIIIETRSTRPDSKFVILGDFNEPYDSLDHILGKWNNGVFHQMTKGSSLTRFPKFGNPSNLDHVLVNHMVKPYFK